MKDIFSDIIRNHRWRDVVCGSGSTLAYTESLRQQLPRFLRRHGISSMLDLPCGDHSWMSLVEFPGDFQYIGADIVDFMIEANRDLYPDREFLVMDLCADPLPPVDLLFCRDCLFHLSEKDIRRAVDNIQRSNIKYIMTTTYVYGNNRDIRTGEFRELDLRLSPYNLPESRDWIDDSGDGKHGQRIMALWSREDFRTREDIR